MSIRHDESSVGATTIASSAEKLSPQVLVVDDVESIRCCIAFVLRASGYQVLEAKNGLAAQKILNTEHPALVISDLEMPICNGWDLLSYCHTEYPELPVVLTSGDLLGKRPEIECWASGFFLKPFNTEHFCNEVQRPISEAA